MKDIEKKKFIVFLTFVLSFWGAQIVSAQQWNELKSDHFIIYYGSKSDRELAQSMLRKAEHYYKRIGSQIGYTRYHKFWTWDERVRIVLYPDQGSFMNGTGQPAWSTGYANRDSQLFQSRSIVTYRQQSEFLDGLLPHEISHLVLHDFILSDRLIPLWFDEGVAQLQEFERAIITDQYMRILVRRGHHIPFAVLMKWDIRQESDATKVKVFYAQSLSIIHYLIKTYGSSDFGNLCRNLRDGEPFEDALRGAYTNRINSLKELEEKWLKFIKQ